MTRWRLACTLGFALWAAGSQLAAGDPGESPALVAAGEYLFDAAGCAGCHTDRKGAGALLAGGRGLTTPFGTFYGPNITPDRAHGIGRWTEQEFLGALRKGIDPEGRPYFPSFPYPSFTGMAASDVRALWAYLGTVPPADRPNTPHDLRAPFGWRPLLHPWRWLYFDPGPFRADPGAPPRVSRGRYLVDAVGHCGECHTPRNLLGGPRTGMYLAGSRDGPDDSAVPNITPDVETGLGEWTESDLAFFLETGMTREGDFAGGPMAEVIDESTSRLTGGDRLSIAAYLKTVPPVAHAVARREPGESASEW